MPPVLLQPRRPVGRAGRARLLRFGARRHSTSPAERPGRRGLCRRAACRCGHRVLPKPQTRAPRQNAAETRQNGGNDRRGPRTASGRRFRYGASWRLFFVLNVSERAAPMVEALSVALPHALGEPRGQYAPGDNRLRRCLIPVRRPCRSVLTLQGAAQKRRKCRGNVPSTFTTWRPKGAGGGQRRRSAVTGLSPRLGPDIRESPSTTRGCVPTLSDIRPQGVRGPRLHRHMSVVDHPGLPKTTE
jgi:hypothetical protein